MGLEIFSIEKILDSSVFDFLIGGVDMATSSLSVGLPQFSGSGSIHRFIEDFKTFSLIKTWDVAHQAAVLPLCLSGIARDAYDCLSSDVKGKISSALEGLQEAFPAKGAVEAQVQLRNLSFSAGVDLDAFLISLKGLVARAFPGGDISVLLFNYFLQTLPAQFQHRLVSDGITSFDEAVRVVRNMCSAARLAEGGAPNSQIRKVEAEYTETSETAMLRNRVAELESRLAQVGMNRGSSRVCFGCGMTGHIQKFCRHRHAVCYTCSQVGHLSRACPGQGSGNPNGATGVAPPVRPMDQMQNVRAPVQGASQDNRMQGQGPPGQNQWRVRPGSFH